jgi:hypothetical protein
VSASVSLRPCIFDVADDHVVFGGEFAPRGFEHGVGLADARRHAEKNLEPSAFLRGLLALKRTQQRIGIGAVAVVHEFILTNPGPDSASKYSDSQHDCGGLLREAKPFTRALRGKTSARTRRHHAAASFYLAS